MAGFSSANLVCTARGANGAPSFWTYRTTDAHATVEGAGYFAGMASPAAGNYGMKLYDIVAVTDTNADTCTIHYVKTVSAAGACTVNAATLA